MHVDSNPSVEELIKKLSSDVHMMYHSLNARIDKLENGLEQKISSKVSQLLDKRVNVEMPRIKKDIDSKLNDLKQSLKAEFTADLEDVSDQVNDIAESINSDRSNIGLNIVVHNLPESSNEQVCNKVNTLIRDGLKLKDVTVSGAERKQSHGKKAGIIIARYRSSSDKQKIMSVKKCLSDHKQFSKVYINHDQCKSERLMQNNLRAVVSALKSSGSSCDIKIVGPRVVVNRPDSSRDVRPANSPEQQNNRRGDSDGWLHVSGYRQRGGNHGNRNNQRNNRRVNH